MTRGVRPSAATSSRRRQKTVVFETCETRPVVRCISRVRRKAVPVMRLIGLSTAGVLFVLSLLHVYWAAGGGWGTGVTIPTRDGRPLFEPPPAGTLLVAFLLLSAGLVVLGRLGIWGKVLPRWPFVVGIWTLVAVFAGRVVGDFRWFGVFKRMNGSTFAWWDTWLYVPLCFLLALGCLLVALRQS